MIPALALKIGAPILGVLLVAGAIWAYNESLRSQGEERLRVENLIQAKEQAETEAVRLKAKEQSRLEIVEKTAHERNEANALLLQAKKRSEQLQRKVHALELKEPEVLHEYIEVETVVEKPVPVCMFDLRQLERLDSSIRVFNRTIANYRDKGAGEAPGELTLQNPGTITCAEIPDLTNEVIARLINTSINHRGLSEYAVDQYEKDLAAKEEDQ